MNNPKIIARFTLNICRKLRLNLCCLSSVRAIASNTKFPRNRIIGGENSLVNSISTAFRHYRSFSSDSLLEREKHMFSLRRRMMALYQSGQDYKGALQCAIELADSVAACEELGGKRSSIYASSLNNVALMVSTVLKKWHM